MKTFMKEEISIDLNIKQMKTWAKHEMNLIHIHPHEYSNQYFKKKDEKCNHFKWI